MIPLLQMKAQESNPALMHRFNLRISGAVPHPLSNRAFRMSFTGIYDLNASFDIRLFSGFFAGIQYKHTLWKTPDNKIPGLNTYGQNNFAGIRVGYAKPINDIAVYYASATAGEGEMHYYGISCLTSSTNTSQDVVSNYMYRSGEIETGVYFYTEGSFAIGLHSSVVFTDFSFDPYKLCLNQHKAYLPEDLGGNLSYLNLGFNVIFSFKKVK
ncbi:MAG: hypothetical protein Fur0041_04200 [Bacteroidia bacterium]